MTVAIERETSSPVKADRKAWTKPKLQSIPIHSALGSHTGSKCDKYGSLSHGEGCPK
jgi:hypothetical protein